MTAAIPTYTLGPADRARPDRPYRPWLRETPVPSLPWYGAAHDYAQDEWCPEGETLTPLVSAVHVAGEHPDWPLPPLAKLPGGPGTWRPDVYLQHGKAGEPMATERVPARDVPLWWHTAGRQYTASGYGSRIPTLMMVLYQGRWRRVYVCIWSNSGTCYIEGDRRAPTDDRRGKREWLVVTE